MFKLTEMAPGVISTIKVINFQKLNFLYTKIIIKQVTNHHGHRASRDAAPLIASLSAVFSE